MLEGKMTLYNIQLILLDRHGVSNMKNRFLLSEVAYTLEGEVRARGCNLYIEFLTECIHVTTNLLDVR
jgi:hypothetical protein